MYFYVLFFNFTTGYISHKINKIPQQYNEVKRNNKQILYTNISVSAPQVNEIELSIKAKFINNKVNCTVKKVKNYCN